MNNVRFEPHFQGDVQGVVIGDNNTVTFIFQGGDQKVVPFLAPPRLTYKLVGRESIIHDIKQRLIFRKDIAITALNGLPGVGKTAIATALAHDPEILKQFTDGILWAGLGREADPLQLLGSWCNALGMQQQEITKLTSIEERVRAAHNAIGLRSMLLIVDDAWHIASALAFKIGGPNCAHLITTRILDIAQDFAGIGSTTVEELTLDEGLLLLSMLAPNVVEAEPEEAQLLVQQVGSLPLALVLMGNYLRKHGKQPRRLKVALQRLKSAEARLQTEQLISPLESHPSLPQGTPVSLQASIRITDLALSKDARRMLRRLSVFPAKPNTFSEEAIIAICTANLTTIDK